MRKCLAYAFACPLPQPPLPFTAYPMHPPFGMLSPPGAAPSRGVLIDNTVECPCLPRQGVLKEELCPGLLPHLELSGVVGPCATGARQCWGEKHEALGSSPSFCPLGPWRKAVTAQTFPLHVHRAEGMRYGGLGLPFPGMALICAGVNVNRGCTAGLGLEEERCAFWRVQNTNEPIGLQWLLAFSSALFVP